MQWVIRSFYSTLEQFSDLSGSEYWNLTTSITLLTLDVFFNLRFHKDIMRSRQIDKLIFVLGGPLLFFLTSIGGIMNYVSYDDVVCVQGCLLSQLLSDLHKFCLIFVSFAIFIQYFYCGRIKNCEFVEPFIMWTVVRRDLLDCDYFCCICGNDVEGNGNVVQVKVCGHMFDEGCLNEWVKIKKECPICRRSLI